MDLSINGASMNVNGKYFCCSRHTGHGGYRRWTRGSRQIVLTERQFPEPLKTWNILEDGSIVGSIVLNSTYGNDNYPVVPDTNSNKT